MRRILSSVSIVALGALFFHAGAGCSSGSGGDSSLPDESCQFAQDDNNCWRQLTKTIDDCLSDEPEGDPTTFFPAPPTVKGVLSSDATSCTYPSGRAVTFAKDPRVQASADAGPSQPERDFTVTMNGKTCVHFVVSDGGRTWNVTGPGGTFAADSSGATTCPDGSRFKVDPLVIFEKCAGAIGLFGPTNLPGTIGTGYNPSTGEVSLRVSGMGKWAYDCTSTGSSGGDAGGD